MALSLHGFAADGGQRWFSLCIPGFPADGGKRYGSLSMYLDSLLIEDREIII